MQHILKEGRKNGPHEFYIEEKVKYLRGSRERDEVTRTHDIQAQFPTNPIVGYKLHRNRKVKSGIVLERWRCKGDRVRGYCVFMKWRANGKTGYIDKS